MAQARKKRGKKERKKARHLAGKSRGKSRSCADPHGGSLCRVAVVRPRLQHLANPPRARGTLAQPTYIFSEGKKSGKNQLCHAGPTESPTAIMAATNAETPPRPCPASWLAVSIRPRCPSARAARVAPRTAVWFSCFRIEETYKSDSLTLRPSLLAVLGPYIRMVDPLAPMFSCSRGRR